TGFFPGRSRTSQPVRRPLPARTTARDTSRDPNPANREVSHEVTRTTGRRTSPTTSLGPARTRTSYERHDPRSGRYRTTGRR
ncbi:MAG: cell division protein, partial [Corynebacterium matruchotii]